MKKQLPDWPSHAEIATARRTAVLAAAEGFELLSGERRQVAARVPTRLLEAVKAQTGLTSTTHILEYALAKVAIEDDFGPKLLELKGAVSPDLDLEF
jgi:hypothetical protein